MRALVALAAFFLAFVQYIPSGALAVEEDRCGKLISAPGQPSAHSALAQINAVRLWSSKAAEIDQNLAVWHNAADPSVKCHQLGDSSMVRCIAKARPCPDQAQVQMESAAQ